MTKTAEQSEQSRVREHTWTAEELIRELMVARERAADPEGSAILHAIESNLALGRGATR